MSYIPSELTLTEPTLGNVFNILTSDKGVYIQTLASTDNINILTSDADPLNTLILDAPITKLKTDNLYIEGKTSGSSYTLPTTQPTDNSVIEFMANGTSSFVPNGGGGGAVNAVLNTAYPTTANAGSVLIMNGGDAVSSSPTDAIIVNAGITTITGGVNITGGDNTNNIYKDPFNQLNLKGENNVYLNSSSGSTFIQSLGGNINLDALSGVISLACIGDINLTPTYGSTKINNNTMLQFPDNTTASTTQLQQDTLGLFNINNNRGVTIYTDDAAGVTVKENLTNTAVQIANGKGNGIIATTADTQGLVISTSKLDIANTLTISSPNINIEDGDVSIIKVDPKLNFNNSDYPTQQCNISFQSANQELVMEHHSPDLASKCNIRLGVNDINIQSTFTPLLTGNINLITQNGFVNINEYKLPNINPTSDGQLLSCNINGESSWITPALPAGLLRAINCNLYTPTEIVDVVWSNLTPEEQLAWKGGDPTIVDPVQSATGNYWNFTKAAPSTNKIGWTIPDDLSALSFQDLQSFWCVIRFNNTTSISTEGSLYLSIQTNPPTGVNTFRTRWNYSNPATAMNQTGYFYKLYALDTITTTTAANFGKGQEVGQTQFKTNPCNVSPDLWSIALNKLVVSPTGDTTAGYTTAPIQSISLQTASNIHTFNFDVVSIGYLNKQYNLQFA